MTTEPKLEAYLSELDQSLGQIPVSDRADIIIEIKSHVLDAQAKDPAQDVSQILHSMGDPGSVAKRFLQERGLTAVPPAKPSSMQWLSASIKWLVIGFLGFMLIIMLGVALLIWKFSPLMAVDEVNHRVLLAGGLIQIQDTKEDKKPKPSVKVITPKTSEKTE